MCLALQSKARLTLLPKEIFCPLAMLGTIRVCATFLGGSMTCMHAHASIPVHAWESVPGSPASRQI